MIYRIKWSVILLLMTSSSVAAQPAEVVIFDEVDGAGFLETSNGTVGGGDELLLVNGNRMPVEPAFSYSGATSGLITYRHTSGSWELEIGRAGWEPIDLSGFDSLVVYLNGPGAISGAELPRIGLEDAAGARTDFVWLSTPENVRVDQERTGFTPESGTNARYSVSYVAALPAGLRRPGYPEDLVITFADAPRDTSVAGIGAPSVPAHFQIETEKGEVPLSFRFRDVNEDSTLSAEGEYIEVLLPESEGADRLRPAWRIEWDASQAPDTTIAPGEGDVFRLAVAFDAFALDGDPQTWQRISIPIADFGAGEAFSPGSFVSVVFAHGGVNPEIRTLWFDLLTVVKNDDEAFLDIVQRATFEYFWQEANPTNGLVRDRTRPESPASIAAVGFGLSAITVGIDRGWISREEGRERVLATLRFFWNAPQSQSPDATGYKGFFYHFLDMETGRRNWNSELSTIDTALLLAGILHVGEYFDGEEQGEEEIRTLAASIYERVDFEWMQFRHPTNPTPAISHGWRPESGFIANDWLGYNEAMILYILALGSPTHAVGPEAWERWVDGYEGEWQTHYGYTFLVFPPLFGHQYSHVWIDFRGIQDAYMREKSIDYFENSRRATLAQRAYHIANPRGWPNYSRDEWGLTASDTPDEYRARGAPPPQNDDGTLVPTAPGGSIVFTPEESIAALRHMYQTYYDRLWGPYGFRDAYNVDENWFDEDYIGIDQGPILLMIENYRTERIWNLFMQNENIQRGLERAGFTATSTAAEEEEKIPAGLGLEGNFPNPFNRTTEIHYYLEHPEYVTLDVYDVLGRLVATLVDGIQTSGKKNIIFDGGELAGGVYFYTLRYGGRIEGGQMVYMPSHDR